MWARLLFEAGSIALNSCELGATASQEAPGIQWTFQQGRNGPNKEILVPNLYDEDPSQRKPPWACSPGEVAVLAAVLASAVMVMLVVVGGAVAAGLTAAVVVTGQMYSEYAAVVVVVVIVAVAVATAAG